MPREAALLKITKSLLNRRNELRKRINLEMDGLDMAGHHDVSGDAADIAFEHTGEELASQLAEIEARELGQIEHALQRIKQGKYGTCAGCGHKILVARLNALPYSTLCIGCQRESEKDSNWLADRRDSDWSTLRDDSGHDDRDVNLSDLEFDLSK